MNHSRVKLALCGSLICLIAAGKSFAEPGRDADASGRSQDAVTIYDSQADHLWNRLHQSLFVRTTSEGKALGHDVVDPLLWHQTKHLLSGPSHEEALRFLDEFLTRDGDKFVRDPLKRAILQHDLWTVFDWTAYPYGWPAAGDEYASARRALQRRLVPAIQRLALSQSAIDSLPDNYMAAVNSKAFPTQADSEHPGTPFLPADLLAPDASWVCVGGPRDVKTPVAPAHARFFSGRSMFLVFLRLPDGRKATLDYLDKLNNFPSPWNLRERRKDGIHRLEMLNLSQELPQFPVGTQVALLRQMVLITDAGKLAVSPVTESLQLCVFRELTRNGQSFSELVLRRSDLFAGKAGGLRPTESDEPAYVALQFVTGYSDPFETTTDKQRSERTTVLKTCASCHPEPGIYSVASFTRRHSARPTTGQPMDVTLWPTAVNTEQKKVLEWKQQQFDWGLFQGLSTR
ncbi:MAG: hypothetical protein HZA46_06070 [Planctomycetales bacterium]|nr:hypothetical protein [Planctomycetales bacterium]